MNSEMNEPSQTLMNVINLRKALQKARCPPEQIEQLVLLYRGKYVTPTVVLSMRILRRIPAGLTEPEKAVFREFLKRFAG